MLTEYRLRGADRDIVVEIVRSSRKTIGLEIRNGCVKARVPKRLSDKMAVAFIEEHREWLEKKLRQIRERSERREENPYPMPELEEMGAAERAAMRDVFSMRTAYYAAQMGVSYGRITIRSQKTRWGSCSGRGNLNFNYRLYFLPREWMDYVIVHELAHRVHMNHSAEFWNLVEQYCPAYRTYRAALKEYSYGNFSG